MNVKEVLTKFGFEVEQDKLHKMEDTLEAINRKIGFLAGVELARGLVELGEKFASFAENMHVAAESAGLTVEEFQKLTFAGKQSAVSGEQMETAMTRLARALYDAKTGGAEAQKAFYLAGISQQQIMGWKTSQEALLGLADRFRAIQDPIQKQALATQLLGRGSIRMVGFLSQGSAAIRTQGSELQKLGGVITTGQVGAQVKLEHALQKVYALISAIGARIAAQFAPALIEMINHFLMLVSANRQLIELNLDRWIYNVTFGMGFLTGLVEDLVKWFVELSKHFHFEGNILDTVARLAGFAAGITTLGAAFKGVSAVVSLMTAPLNLVLGSLVAIVAAGHDLYDMLFEGGKFEDTWTYKFFDMLGLGKTLTAGIDTLSTKAADIVGPAIYGGNGGTVTNNITVHAQTGASPHEIGKVVADSLMRHTETQLRGAQAGVAPGVVR